VGGFPVEHRGEAGRFGVLRTDVDDQVAHPEVAVHEHEIGGRGTVEVQPAKRPLECRSGVTHVVEPVAPGAGLVLLGDVGGADVGTVDRGKRSRALVQQPGAGVGVECPQDSTRNGLACDEAADQERCTECVGGLVGGDHLGYRRAGHGREALRAGFEQHARVDLVGRSGAQD
jgi:hypothetical protein